MNVWRSSRLTKLIGSSYRCKWSKPLVAAFGFFAKRKMSATSTLWWAYVTKNWLVAVRVNDQ